MEFDSVHKVKVETMNQEEAKAFLKFLRSEVNRHFMDIEDAITLMEKVTQEHGLG